MSRSQGVAHAGALAGDFRLTPEPAADAYAHGAPAREDPGRLVRNAEFVSPHSATTTYGVPGADEARTRQRRRWALREVHRNDTAEVTNQKKCGRVRYLPDVEVRERAEPGELGRAHYHGLVRCDSWSACPVCSARLAASKGEELQAGVAAHVGAGGWAYLVTVTVRHDAGAPLEPLYAAMSDAWRFVRSGAPWIRWRERIGYVGAVRGTEVTVGKHGWHPHVHAVFFTRRRLDGPTVRAFERWLAERWQRRIRSRLGERFAPTIENGVRVCDGQNAARYLAKMGLSRELTGVGQKRGRGGNRTPWQVLSDYADSRRPTDRALWVEWCRAVRGRAQLFWTPGLRAHVEACATAQQTLDLGLDAAAAEPEYVVLAEIPGSVWDAIADVPGVPMAVLEAAERHDVAGVQGAIYHGLTAGGGEPSPQQHELQRSQWLAGLAMWGPTADAEWAHKARERGDVTPYVLRTRRQLASLRIMPLADGA